MNKAQLQEQWNYLGKVLGNIRKQVELIPEERLGFKPTAETRSICELCVHIHEFLVEGPQTVVTGKQVDIPTPAFSKKADLLRWVDQQVTDGFAAFAKTTDSQIANTITAYGSTFSGSKILSLVYDEVIHHRGQLTVYLRLIGIPPIIIYSFDD
jgi:uncharacterized damage-inducible protein DinB